MSGGILDSLQTIIPTAAAVSYTHLDGYIITRLSREKINILMEDEQDGIEAREIVKGVYVTFPK